MSQVRQPAVAGSFYPADPEELGRMVRRLLEAVPPPPDGTPLPKAIIAPHAGYIYSGPIAATVYARLAPLRGVVRRVVLLGPSHRLAFHGIAVSEAALWRTPLGDIPVDREAAGMLLRIPGLGTLEAAHQQEHSLEVHLPFLQAVLGDFALVPLVAGEAPAELVAQALDAVWGGEETLIVVSSDLSHYLDRDAARALDARTSAAIAHCDGAAIAYEQACGRVPIGGLLTVARRRHLRVETLDLRNSGDTAGPADRVVGYGAWAFCAPAEDEREVAEAPDGRLLLRLAAEAVRAAAVGGPPPPLPEDLPESLRRPGAAFVTLKRQGALRGCIGSPVSWRPLGQDVVDNAVKAAREDPRFPPVAPEELPGLDISVSVLTPPEPMAVSGEADLLARLRPGIDGLIIEEGGHRALFLPAVWEMLPQPADFLRQLKLKAGLPADHWSPGFRVQRFRAVEVAGEKP